MPTPDEPLSFPPVRAIATLVGGDLATRSEICACSAHSAAHVESIGDIGDLTGADLAAIRVLLVWDDGRGSIEHVHTQFPLTGRRPPIIAISDSPTVRKVVEALAAGAIDYVDWSDGMSALEEAVCSAHVFVEPVRTPATSEEPDTPCLSEPQEQAKRTFWRNWRKVFDPQ